MDLWRLSMPFHDFTPVYTTINNIFEHLLLEDLLHKLTNDLFHNCRDHNTHIYILGQFLTYHENFQSAIKFDDD